MVGAEGFEPSTSWSRTRSSCFPLSFTVRYLTLQSATYEQYIGNDRTLNSSVVGTVLGTITRGLSVLLTQRYRDLRDTSNRGTTGVPTQVQFRKTRWCQMKRPPKFHQQQSGFVETLANDLAMAYRQTPRSSYLSKAGGAL